MGVRQDHSAKARTAQRVGQRAPPAQQTKWLAGAAFEPPVWAMHLSDDEIHELVHAVRRQSTDSASRHLL